MKRVEPTEPAFPKPYSEAMGYGGINVRTYIATHALAGLMASAADLSPSIAEDERMLTVGQLVAKRSVQYADALIAELNKTDS